MHLPLIVLSFRSEQGAKDWRLPSGSQSKDPSVYSYIASSPPFSLSFSFPPFPLCFTFDTPSRLRSAIRAKSLIRKKPFLSRFNLRPHFRSCMFDTLHGYTLPPLFTLWYSVLITASHTHSWRTLVIYFLTLADPCLSYKLLITSLRPHEDTLVLSLFNIQVFQ